MRSVQQNKVDNAKQTGDKTKKGQSAEQRQRVTDRERERERDRGRTRERERGRTRERERETCIGCGPGLNEYEVLAKHFGLNL